MYQNSKKRWVTFIAVNLEDGKRAEKAKSLGYSYAELFRTGIRAFEKHMKSPINKPLNRN